MFWNIPKLFIDKYLKELIYIENKSFRLIIATFGTIIPIEHSGSGAVQCDGKVRRGGAEHTIFLFVLGWNRYKARLVSLVSLLVFGVLIILQILKKYLMTIHIP